MSMNAHVVLVKMAEYARTIAVATAVTALGAIKDNTATKVRF